MMQNLLKFAYQLEPVSPHLGSERSVKLAYFFDKNNASYLK
jgi:hypothetical protein